MTNGFNEERVILDKVNLTIYQGIFITILGGNGAGKSTLFNVIAGLPLTSGSVHILGEDVTNWPAEKRADWLCLSRSENGNISRMTVAETCSSQNTVARDGGWYHVNYLNRKRNLLNSYRELKWFGKHLETPAGLLSGGHVRIEFLMASLKTTRNYRYLDEHIYSLDPENQSIFMQLTDELIATKGMTALMDY